MLSALVKSTTQFLIATSANRSEAPFLCPECKNEVSLRSGAVRLPHFSHKRPIACTFGVGESESHRRCKLEIYEALQKLAGAEDIALERSFGSIRPDVSAIVNGVRIAI